MYVNALRAELYYVVLSWFGGAERLQHLPLAWVWMEYGKADRRWQQVDATVMSIELATVGFVAPLCFLLVYGIYHRRPWRHFVQVIVCVCELYGGWMTFAPEWLTDSPSLDTSTFKLLYASSSSAGRICKRCTMTRVVADAINVAVDVDVDVMRV